MSRRSVLCSVDERYWRLAAADLQRAFPSAPITRLGDDLGLLEVDGSMTPAEVAATVREHVPWVRHLAGVDRIVQVGADLDAVADAALEFVEGHETSWPALQVLTSGDGPVKAETLRATVTERFDEAGYGTLRSGTVDALVVCLVEGRLFLGVTEVEHMLSDWPGGKMWLRRPDEQVSRAEFKLEELCKVFPLDLSRTRTAIDLGGSPGGWTRILRTMGIEVWLVDPAPVDPRLLADDGVHHVETTAGRFAAESNRHFDLIVNDMRMPAKMSCELTCELADRLAPNGLAVVTFKLTPETAQRVVRTGRKALEKRYDIVFARQLFHNRNEITVVGRRRGG